MKMILKVVAWLAMSLVGPAAFAELSCTSSSDLGSMGPPGLTTLGNSFNSASLSDYTDCYSFNLTSDAASFGGAIEINKLLNSLDINLKSVSLYSGASLLGYDDSPLFFSFGAVAGGTYTLAIASAVTESFGFFKQPVGYLGLFTTYASPAPEPASVAMLLIGLLGVGVAARRKMG